VSATKGQAQGSEDHTAKKPKKARRPECRNCGKRAATPQAAYCTRCGHSLGSTAPPVLAKAPEDDRPERTCVVCAGQGRVTTPAHGREGRVCEACGGSGTVTGSPDAPDTAKAAGLSAAEEARLARLLRKARDADPDTRLSAIGELAEKAGAEMTARIMSGDTVSPAAFTRAYLANGRAPQ
jgi:hypothetical protein